MVIKALKIVPLMIPIVCQSQIVKFIKNPAIAQYRAFISKYPVDATHWIYRVASPADIRKPSDWYIVPNPQLFKKSITLYEVVNRKEADWIIYYVSSRDSARIQLNTKY
jgi:hypothetical protein